MKTLTKSIGIALVVLLLIYLVLISILLFRHTQTLIMSTDRMQPSIPQGSLLFFEKVEARSLQLNDIVSFTPQNDSYAIDTAYNNSYLVSRIFGIINTDDGLIFRTKSDAYDRLDFEFVKESDIHGRITSHIPFLGSLVDNTNTFVGKLLLVAPIIILIVLIIILNRRMFFRTSS